MVDKRTVLV